MIAAKSIMIQSKSQPTHALYPDEPAVGFPSYRLPPDAKYLGVQYEAYRSTREVKSTLSTLLNRVLESLYQRGGQIAYLQPIAPTRARRAGFAKGTFTYIAPDFDAPLDDFSDYQ